MNKLMWRIYLNNITDTHKFHPMGFPDMISNRSYSFKFKKIFKDNLSLCPKQGLPNVFKEFYKYYRITGLNIIVTNGEFCENTKDEIDINCPNYKKGTFKLIYYPNNPEFSENNKKCKLWVIKGKLIEICLFYEIIPLYPYITIPNNFIYNDLEEFQSFYNSIEKNPHTQINLKNDIVKQKTIDPNISLEDLLIIIANGSGK